jgi:fluoroacetyl-CoA thioesterase
MLEAGLMGKAECKVTEENTAAAMGSGDLAVFATPAMVALMEKAASESVLPYFEEGQTSVGTLMHISHVSATPVGMTVRGESRLEEIDGRRLVFSVKAFDEAGLIGEGTHERFIVQREKFMLKTAAKKGQSHD